MAHDSAFRCQQALDPSALTTLAACLDALEAAVHDPVEVRRLAERIRRELGLTPADTPVGQLFA